MTNYAEKLMRKYRSSVQNIKEDLIEFARRSIKKTDVYVEQNITDLDFLETQGVDISDLVNDLKSSEEKIVKKQEVLNLIYKIKNKEDILKLRRKIIKTLGKTTILSRKKLKKIKDTAEDKERKARYLRWLDRESGKVEGKYPPKGTKVELGSWKSGRATGITIWKNGVDHIEDFVTGDMKNGVKVTNRRVARKLALAMIKKHKWILVKERKQKKNPTFLKDWDKLISSQGKIKKYYPGKKRCSRCKKIKKIVFKGESERYRLCNECFNFMYGSK